MNRRLPDILTALLGVLLGLGAVHASAPSVASGQAGLTRRAVAPMVASDGPKTVDSVTIDFLDVGQGEAILVTANGRRLLVDGGPSRDRLRARL